MINGMLKRMKKNNPELCSNMLHYLDLEKTGIFQALFS